MQRLKKYKHKLIFVVKRANKKSPVNVTSIDIHHDNKIESFRYDGLYNANGGAAFYPVGTPPNSSEGQQIVWCDEGNLVDPSQLVLVDPAKNTSRVILNNFLGRNYSSINDIEQNPYTGDLWYVGTTALLTPCLPT